MADLVLLRVPIDDKSEEFIEVQVAADELGQTLPTGPQPAADDGARIKKAGFTLSSAMDGVMPALRVILGKVRDGVHSPDEITMTLGLQIGGETRDCLCERRCAGERGSDRDLTQGRPA